MNIIKNDFLRIAKLDDGVYLETYKKGYSMYDFNAIMEKHPEIRITSFISIRKALLHAPHPQVRIGSIDERIVVELTDNDMHAYISLHIDESELSESNRADLIREILIKLWERGVVFGIKKDVLLNGLRIGEPILIAEGIPPVNGRDSVIRMYELKEPKPEIKEDGRADYYELNLINKVKEGDWLGERTEPTDGTPGKSVKGETIHQLKGKRFPLFYDPATVREEYSDGVTRLFSKINGAVHYNGDMISVSNYLEIMDNVDFNTGNIDFDGYLTVRGSIADNFSVAARDDIEILGEFGVGSVKEVVSRGGNILIKGGIAGRNKAVIKSTKDIYTKYISDATVICSGIVYVGYYCLNSNIRAKQVIVESSRGRIIGGKIEAEQKVEAAYIGNEHENRTEIIVAGFDRSKMKEELDNLNESLIRARMELSKAKQLFALYNNSPLNTSKQFKDYESIRDKYFECKDRIKQLENEIKKIKKYFQVKGEGEVNILRKVHPNTMIQIKSDIKEIRKSILAPCFFIQDMEIKEL